MKILQRLLRPECHRVQQVLQSYLDGELGDEDAAMVAAHLQWCERCGIEADLYERVKASIADLRVVPDPDVMARLQQFADMVPQEVEASSTHPDSIETDPPGGNGPDDDAPEAR